MGRHRAARRGSWGWLPILGYAAVHNCWATGTRREMLSQTARRLRRARPILVPTATLGLWAHCMGYLPRWADPLYWLGVLAERMADLTRRIVGASK